MKSRAKSLTSAAISTAFTALLRSPYVLIRFASNARKCCTSGSLKRDLALDSEASLTPYPLPLNPKKAFSLIELSIVLTVIAALIIGVIGGSGMIRASTIAGARSFTAKSVVPSISGLVAWYETSTINSLVKSEAYDGAQVSTWYDISPNSISAQRNTLSRTASSALTYMDDGINDIPSLSFIGTGNITLSNFYQGSLAQSTVFVVFRPLAMTSGAFTILGTTFLDSYSSGSTSSISFSATTVDLNAGTAVSTGTSTNSASFTVGNSYIVATYFNGSSSKAYVNNAATSAGSSTIDCGTNALTGLTIGSNKSGSNNFYGFISEIIIYNRQLQLQERTDIFKYLSYKYQISVTGI